MEFLSVLLSILGVFIGLFGASILLFINEAICNENKAEEILKTLKEKTGQELIKEQLYTDLFKIKNIGWIIFIIGITLITIGICIFLFL